MNELLTYINKISTIKEITFNELKKSFKPLYLKKNDFFVREGEYAKQFFVDSSIIGAYNSLLTKQPNKIAQQALTDCEVLVADYTEMENLYTKFHDLERLGRRIAEFYFLEKEQKEIKMALLDADKRYLIMQQRFPSIENIIPQYYIASYLGISPTQLSRIRKKLKDS